MRSRAFQAIFILLIASPAIADQVIGVSDGDTLTILRDRRPIKIRLAEIDSPEKPQPFGNRAKQSLSDICYQTDALVIPTATEVSST